MPWSWRATCRTAVWRRVRCSRTKPRKATSLAKTSVASIRRAKSRAGLNTQAHARIVSIDTAAAEAMDGVEGVITCADVPCEDGFGVFVNAQPVMARDKV